MASKRFQKVYIEITNRCNLHCSFCPETMRASRRMTPTEFEQILSEVKPYTDYICLHVKGEPLSHPELGDLLKLAHTYGLQVNLTTNGTLLARQTDLLTGPYAPRQVSLSLHSFDANDLPDQADPQAAFENYLENCISFAKNFTEKTKGYLSFRLWNLADDASRDQYEKNAFILRRLEEAYGIKDHVESRTGKYTGNAIADRTYLNFDHLFGWPDPKAPWAGDKGTCYGLRKQLAILADGTVVPCCLDGEGRLPLGNILIEPLSDILSKEKSLRMVEGFQNHQITEDLCRHCGYRTRF